MYLSKVRNKKKTRFIFFLFFFLPREQTIEGQNTFFSACPDSNFPVARNSSIKGTVVSIPYTTVL